MKIFLTGASGYIGGSLAKKLIERGHEVLGLVRSKDKSNQLRELGVKPILGSLDDSQIVGEAAREADGVINAANSDHRPVVDAVVEALTGTGKPFIQTSGSSIVCDDARGESERSDVFTDDTPFNPIPEKAARVAIDKLVRKSGIELGIRSIVICPTLVYGRGHGLHKESVQIPRLVEQSRKRQAGVYIGQGLNVWSTVFIDDLVDLFVLALEKAPTGSFFFAENGEQSFKNIAESISRNLGFGGRTESWDVNEAVRALGDELARFALASNSRVRAINARRLLGWKPSGHPVLEAIEHNL
jgi:nucleoside-diphosphate-sugar epimerase